MQAIVLVGAALSTWVCILFARRYLIGRGILDAPNERKLHVVPTPRGGGIGIVLVTLVGTLLAGAMGWTPIPVVLALVGGGLGVALVGWLDDRKGLSALGRLAMHGAASVWAVYWLGGFTILTVNSASAIVGWVDVIVSVFLITWAISAYNFMDGIDALAGVEAVQVGLVGGAIAFAGGHRDVGFLAWLLASSALGFLLWNLPPAKIFLGDVGSGFLGFSFAVLALFSERQGALPAVGWLVLLGVFAFDSTFTLCRRLVRGERWLATHRESAYQRAALRAGHAPVTLAVAAVNVALAVLCVLAWMVPERWPAVMAAAAGLLVALYLVVERYAPIEKVEGRRA